LFQTSYGVSNLQAKTTEAKKSSEAQAYVHREPEGADAHEVDCSILSTDLTHQNILIDHNFLKTSLEAGQLEYQENEIV